MKAKSTFQFICLAALAALTLLQPARAEEAALKVASLKGSATLERAREASTLTPQSAVKQGDIIQTGADGEVSLTWGGGHVVKIYPLSKLTVDAAAVSGQGETNEVNLESGKIFAKVNKLKTSGSKFQIRTPTAIAGARGSEIFVAQQGGAASFSVVSGEFSVTAPNLDAVVGQNFRIRVSTDATQPSDSAPQPISNAELQELKQEVEAIRQEVGADAYGQEAASPEEKTEGTPAASNDDLTEATQNTVNETVTNDTITNTTVDAVIQLLEGTGAINLTIE